ncbi:type VII secretion protein EccB [Qaidamihabitans albus]|uniref:type VII secretion protein EccB n=1 Tax=Qaidamihabitans albus TaxID=2795733 RepID=UPI0018F22E88|nr:type VII secretion protein EccB [Qaidamihabitans albus]
MPSRKDQLHSYQFMMQRVVSSLMVHETDPEQTPLRRGVGAAFAGIMIAALVAVIFGVIGVFTNVGGSGWRENGSIILEEETGATYVYHDGAVRPVLNYASARLISGQPQAEAHRLSTGDLAGVPRGVTVGIPGAPDSLPARDQTLGMPWSTCEVPGEDTAGTPTTTTTLMVGERPPGGAPLGQRGLLVRDTSDGATYLVWRGHRYPIAGDTPESVVRSLYGAGREPVETGAAWLNVLPAGQAIEPIAVPARGEDSTAVPGRTVGEVVYHPITGGMRQHYLVLDDGLAPLTDLQVRVLQGQQPTEPQRVSAQEAGQAPTSRALAPAGGETEPPETPPGLASLPADGRISLCSVTSGVGATPEIRLGVDTANLRAGVETSVASGTGARLADRVFVPPGRVAVVRALPSSTARAGAFSVVTDRGLRFPVPSREELAALGFQPGDAVDAPETLVRRIPSGPTLSAAAAMRAAPVHGPVG